MQNAGRIPYLPSGLKWTYQGGSVAQVDMYCLLRQEYWPPIKTWQGPSYCMALTVLCDVRSVVLDILVAQRDLRHSII